jgi:hypothetical protein
LGPSLAQWTPSMATRGGATTFETIKNKYNKPNVKINILYEIYFYMMKVLQKWIDKQKFKMKYS